jgi:hypothetical protein
MDHEKLADLARPALIIAAARRSVLTYKELGRAIDYPPGTPLPHHMNRVLDIVSDRCEAAGEPSLAVLVVNQETGMPGEGFRSGARAWHAEAQACYRHWTLG